MLENLIRGEITPDSAMQLARWIWWLLAAAWVVKAFMLKRVKRSETHLERATNLIPLLIGFWLLFDQTLNDPWLDFRLLPNLPPIWWTGLFLTAVGVATAIWARWSLGANWSGAVTLKDAHEPFVAVSTAVFAIRSTREFSWPRLVLA